jgi:hypothetical protein
LAVRIQYIEIFLTNATQKEESKIYHGLGIIYRKKKKKSNYDLPAYNHLQSNNEEGEQAFLSKYAKNEKVIRTAKVEARVRT